MKKIKIESKLVKKGNTSTNIDLGLTEDSLNGVYRF
jgi:hypothetical protein